MSKEKKEMMYEGKAKKIYATDNADEIIVYYKDDATAFNGEKKGSIKDKGVMNNEITTLLFKMLEKNGIKTHFIEKLSDREQLCQKVKIFPLEVIVRNLIAGSMAKRLGIEEGTVPPNTIFEICYKNDEYGDPLINDHHAVALKLATYDELKYIYEVTAKVNNLLKDALDKIGITLVDFKVEFGKNDKGEILLADEITPDTCRFWDKETGKKLDKDRFRRDLGSIEEAYIEVLNRLNNL
ncbi:phosphoribosylaminoimidazolesuccinocarboxamide synthase [Brachyspira hyodysenteriae]|uniref:Phosphoribosylaminoimidazole-succinocarboxamide synthase n=2 Tax=Brachyspira hyodysenteriae TaxID=159 RepID=A0A3B6VAB0_BRAHW|nr:phosphoribosylaminoimidazolesuccinocarboxamide synthase [Brachyspira hyodysenteriae]ACN83630.1 Phosphoribosylamidoimidazole-succinocarboxamide synthase [Brachyspira hyodysenteriae WA1]ANN64249.1 phosphoribosylaminoimidazolesuccinocarboxamide synthase [Brachyspira hyodysenteriae ATCC 27164]KLI17867.1 phosphoribosylaminoimidazole-succinocarboxamide synthase [Brachyspira hyodysenteriae]KLI26884.1 phosphoribosylaminoimidazole-succinocarboxamide synthase [Brachyspira hyodysenteriae]KLI40356.1 ph